MKGMAITTTPNALSFEAVGSGLGLRNFAQHLFNSLALRLSRLNRCLVRAFVVPYSLLDQLQQWRYFAAFIGVSWHFSCFHQELQGIRQSIRQRPLLEHFDLLYLQSLCQQPKATHNSARNWCRVTRFKSRSNLGTQGSVVFCRRSHKPILEVSGQSQVRLYVFRGHPSIIQAKCLHATKQSATFQCKQSAT